MTFCWIWGDTDNTWSELVYHPACAGRHGAFFNATRRSAQWVQTQAFMSLPNQELSQRHHTSDMSIPCSVPPGSTLTSARMSFHTSIFYRGCIARPQKPASKHRPSVQLRAFCRGSTFWNFNSPRWKLAKITDELPVSQIQRLLKCLILQYERRHLVIRCSYLNFCW